MPLQEQGPVTPSCINKSISGRSREERDAYPEVHSKMRGNDHTLQRGKLKFSLRIKIFTIHTKQGQSCVSSSWLKICLGDDQNTTGQSCPNSELGLL